MGLEPGFHNSIHSSLVEAAVPAQATSLMITLRKPTGVGVRVIVGVLVGVWVVVGVDVAVGEEVEVGDEVRVIVGVGFPQVVIGLIEFCGSLGLRRKKSVELLFESVQLPETSSWRS